MAGVRGPWKLDVFVAYASPEHSVFPEELHLFSSRPYPSVPPDDFTVYHRSVSCCSISHPPLFSVFHIPFQEWVIFMRLLAYCTSAMVLVELLCLRLAALRSIPHSMRSQKQFHCLLFPFFFNENCWVDSCPLLLKA